MYLRESEAKSGDGKDWNAKGTGKLKWLISECKRVAAHAALAASRILQQVSYGVAIEGSGTVSKGVKHKYEDVRQVKEDGRAGGGG